MRSPVQSWVPLQESTAECCVFFVYRHQAFPKGLDIGVFWRWKLAFKATEMAMAGSERSERGLMAIAANSIASKDFLGYHANGQNGLEGAARGAWNILGPATWKSSTYEIFVSAFFVSFLTSGTLREHKLFYFSLFKHKISPTTSGLHIN